MDEDIKPRVKRSCLNLKCIDRSKSLNIETDVDA